MRMKDMVEVGERKDKKARGKILPWLARFMTKKVIIILLVAVVVLAVGIGVSTSYQTDSKITKLGFEDIGELATQTARSSTVYVQDADRKLFDISIPFTQTKYIYSYDTVIRAGFDFGDIKWSVDEEKKEIILILPEARVLSAELDLESFKVYHEQKSVFTNVSLAQDNEARIKLRDDAQKAAIDNGLLENATDNAKVLLEAFIGKVYNLEEYSVFYE